MPTHRQVERAAGELGELLSRHEGAADLEEYSQYRTDPVAFAVEACGDTDPGPWSVQRQVMRLVEAHDRVAWRSGQGVGKGWTISRLMAWWAYSVQGLVLLSAPTSRTVHETHMRKEFARLHRKAGLPGELYVNALRIRDDEASVLAYTTAQVSGGTGHHDRAVLAILDEAQGVDEAAWEAMFANVTGEDDKLFVCGNPVRPTGPFFEVSRPDSGWQTVQTSSLDHPNLTDEPIYIPGGPSREWLQRMRDRWGEGSPMWTARVMGEFPRDAVSGLYSYGDVEAAMERDLPPSQDAEPVVAVDVARHGLDSSVACIRHGPVVEGLVAWSGASTTETVEKVKQVAHEAGVRRKPKDLPRAWRQGLKARGEYGRGEIRVDEIGIGAGVVDQLKDEGWPVRGFKSSRKAREKRRFADRRAEAHWRLHELLEAGEIALPRDEELREEMLAVEWSPDAKDRVRIESKDTIKKKIGRSPDRLDAVCMAFVERVGKRPGKKRIVKY